MTRVYREMGKDDRLGHLHADMWSIVHVAQYTQHHKNRAAERRQRSQFSARTESAIYSASQNKSPKGWEFLFNFLHIDYVPIYARLQIFYLIISIFDEVMP